MRIVLVVLGFYLVICDAGTFFNPPDPNNPGKCIYDDVELQRGKNQVSGFCAAIHCNDDGSWTLVDCGIKRVERCKRGDFVDLSLPYPDCCKWYFECENEQGTFMVIR